MIGITYFYKDRLTYFKIYGNYSETSFKKYNPGYFANFQQFAKRLRKVQYFSAQ